MRLRMALLLACILVVAACGLSDSSTDELAPTTAPASSSPDDEAKDDEAGDDGTKDDEERAETPPGSTDKLSDHDFAAALPTEDDLPDGFMELDIDELYPEDGEFEEEFEEEFGEDEFDVEVDASPECIALQDRIDTLTLDSSAFASFFNDDEVGLDVTVAVAGAVEREAFEDLDQIGACQSFREVHDDGKEDVISFSTRTADLGELSFVVDMTIDLADEPPSGITIVHVLHGDAVFTIDLYDGYDLDDVDEAPIPRDPALAMTVAQLVDERVGEIQAD